MSSPSPSPDSTDPEQEDPTTASIPLPLSASLILDHLPKSASQALTTAGQLDQEKVTIRLTPLPNTPALKVPRFKCSSHQRFEYIVKFLRRKLGVKDFESVFCYVNSVFAPGLDEGVGNLWRCFKVGEDLVVSYSVTQAFG
ncbi:uncharacterized protein MYCFIDRAFT_128222 [Pseudocercospora fijiensis CIRAD86]|uniref:Ubiquitin-like protein ATG12 n=1 Tax=Pseudocercospora fijiensis (strain CIRAD86) TaxID=383855 RepID=N1Q9E0_PSEFD|nr:uncharacterized protein MYCFIDRAFT_128222 [Pseudocercospora fijiensis CIRAD86]EME89515.1 hypothetical protein MYCFIDRAFT_128222 [Pseudocercospora fijiensis CIRAD86]